MVTTEQIKQRRRESQAKRKPEGARTATNELDEFLKLLSSRNIELKGKPKQKVDENFDGWTVEATCAFTKGHTSYYYVRTNGKRSFNCFHTGCAGHGKRWDPDIEQLWELAGKEQKAWLQGPKVGGTPYDFVINPRNERDDGLFPRGDISLIAAASGGGKTTWLFDILEKQAIRLPVYGRATNGLPYLILLEDRGEFSMTRTLKRMGIDQRSLRYDRLGEGPLAIAFERALLKQPIMPAVVFLEGIDLIGDSRDPVKVSQNLKMLQQLVEHYHIALIGSTGSPKQKPKDRYLGLRDQVINSAVWQRKTETIVVLQREHGKETDEITVVTILPRNGRPEQYQLVFDPETGRLRNLTDTEIKDRQGDAEESEFVRWVLTQEVFTSAQARKAFPKMSGESVTNHLKKLVESKIIIPDGLEGKGRRKTVRFIVPATKIM